MSLGRRISWWALLAMVFLVPIAMSNVTFLGFKDPFTHDVFDIVKVSLERLLGLIALAAWAWDLLRKGGRIRHHPVDWLILAFLAWVAVTTATSVHWPTAFLGKPLRYEGLLSFVTYAIIYFLVLQFADHASRVRRLAQSLFWAERDRGRLWSSAVRRSGFRSLGGASFRSRPCLLDLRQPRLPRWFPDLLGHGRARARAAGTETRLAHHLLGRLRP